MKEVGPFSLNLHSPPLKRSLPHSISIGSSPHPFRLFHLASFILHSSEKRDPSSLLLIVSLFLILSDEHIPSGLNSLRFTHCIQSRRLWTSEGGRVPSQTCLEEGRPGRVRLAASTSENCLFKSIQPLCFHLCIWLRQACSLLPSTAQHACSLLHFAPTLRGQPLHHFPSVFPKVPHVSPSLTHIPGWLLSE